MSRGRKPGTKFPNGYAKKAKAISETKQEETRIETCCNEAEAKPLEIPQSQASQ